MDEGTGLENRQVSNGFVGSNPTPSAMATVAGTWLRHKDFRLSTFDYRLNVWRGTQEAEGAGLLNR